ncbi:MAG: antibiotic biosynthesis monooxygenase [Nitrospiraceae bacterium]|nr:antibiotic biosynthesis monooxygenase [Nitrospiraceae bacterium]
MAFSRRDFVAAILCSGAGVAYAADQGGNAGSGSKGDKKPVFVVAAIEVKPGKRSEFIDIFKSNIPNVLAEDGCFFYEPVVDFPSGIGIQDPLRENVMTVVEKWASIEALQAHLKAPHMVTYGQQVKDLVTGVKLQVMQPA